MYYIWYVMNLSKLQPLDIKQNSKLDSAVDKSTTEHIFVNVSLKQPEFAPFYYQALKQSNKAFLR